MSGGTFEVDLMGATWEHPGAPGVRVPDELVRFSVEREGDLVRVRVLYCGSGGWLEPELVAQGEGRDLDAASEACLADALGDGDERLLPETGRLLMRVGD